MAQATLTITSKNYSSWSLRGWLLARFAGLDFVEADRSGRRSRVRAELLLLSSSILVPCLEHDGITVWDTLAIGEYLNDIRPEARLLPTELARRTQCRSICGEMHSGFTALRSSLPMNLKAHFPGLQDLVAARRPISTASQHLERMLRRMAARTCLASARWPMPCTRRLSPVSAPMMYGLDWQCAGYCELIMAMPEMIEWVAAAIREPDEIEEFEAEF